MKSVCQRWITVAPAPDVLLSFKKTPSSRVHESLQKVKMLLRLAHQSHHWSIKLLHTGLLHLPACSC